MLPTISLYSQTLNVINMLPTISLYSHTLNVINKIYLHFQDGGASTNIKQRSYYVF